MNDRKTEKTTKKPQLPTDLCANSKYLRHDSSHYCVNKQKHFPILLLATYGLLKTLTVTFRALII